MSRGAKHEKVGASDKRLTPAWLWLKLINDIPGGIFDPYLYPNQLSPMRVLRGSGDGVHDLSLTNKPVVTNPPYSKIEPHIAAMSAARKEFGKPIRAVVPVRTNREWFTDTDYDWVAFLGRVSFHDENGHKMGSPGWDTAVIGWGPMALGLATYPRWTFR